MINIKSELSEKYDRYKRIIQHIPVGIFNAFLFLVSPLMAVLLGAGFVCYQVMQFIQIRNKGWRDIAGWLYGLGIGGALLFILRMLRVL